MTANRWWVQSAARWFARFKTTEGQLRSISLGIAAFSTFSLVLQNAGLGQYVPHVGVISAGLWIGYTYLYAEGGVHNQAQRDMADLADNYTAPTMLLEKNIQSTQLAYLAAQLDGDLTFEEAVEEMDALTVEEWQEYRDGVPEEML